MSGENKGKEQEEERELIEFPFSYYADSSMKLLGYMLFLDKHIKLGNKISARLLKEFMKVLGEPILLKDKLLLAQKKHLIEITIAFFKKIDGYTFEKMVMDGFFNDIPDSNLKPNQKIDFNDTGKKYEVIYSFDDMIIKIYDSILPVIEDIKKLRHRRVFIRKIYRIIDKYISKLYNKDDYSVYRRKVITAFICTQFGLYKTKKDYTGADYTQYLFEKVRSPLEDFK